jgi:hypothetical protein
METNGLDILRTASIHLEGVRKRAKDLVQNPIFGCVKCEAENLTAQLLRSVKPIFIFTSYACTFSYESKKASLIERLKKTYDSF